MGQNEPNFRLIDALRAVRLGLDWTEGSAFRSKSEYKAGISFVIRYLARVYATDQDLSASL
jgi:hypothetical protein